MPFGTIFGFASSLATGLPFGHAHARKAATETQTIAEAKQSLEIDISNVTNAVRNGTATPEQGRGFLLESYDSFRSAARRVANGDPFNGGPPTLTRNFPRRCNAGCQEQYWVFVRVSQVIDSLRALAPPPPAPVNTPAPVVLEMKAAPVSPSIADSRSKPRGALNSFLAPVTSQPAKVGSMLSVLMALLLPGAAILLLVALVLRRRKK